MRYKIFELRYDLFGIYATTDSAAEISVGFD